MEKKTVRIDVPVVKVDTAAIVRRPTAGAKCEYDGIMYNDGAIICGGGQLLQCRDGGWDVIKPTCD